MSTARATKTALNFTSLKIPDLDLAVGTGCEQAIPIETKTQVMNPAFMRLNFPDTFSFQVPNDDFAIEVSADNMITIRREDNSVCSVRDTFSNDIGKLITNLCCGTADSIGNKSRKKFTGSPFFTWRESELDRLFILLPKAQFCISAGANDEIPVRMPICIHDARSAGRTGDTAI